MKKIITSLAVLSAIILISGCGSNKGSQNGATNNPPATSNMSTPTPVDPSQVPSSSQQSPTDVTSASAISIQGFAFSPATLTVKKGTTVTWTNNDSVIHTIKSASFNSGNLAKGDTFKFTFDTAGTFDYSCGVHPSMTGKIIVQ